MTVLLIPISLIIFLIFIAIHDDYERAKEIRNKKPKPETKDKPKPPLNTEIEEIINS